MGAQCLVLKPRMSAFQLISSASLTSEPSLPAPCKLRTLEQMFEWMATLPCLGFLIRPCSTMELGNHLKRHLNANHFILYKFSPNKSSRRVISISDWFVPLPTLEPNPGLQSSALFTYLSLHCSVLLWDGGRVNHIYFFFFYFLLEAQICAIYTIWQV